MSVETAGGTGERSGGSSAYPAYPEPLFSLTFMAIDTLIIYGLVAYGNREAAV
jgi:hypothetical protein